MAIATNTIGSRAHLYHCLGLIAEHECGTA
jgi:hypothetical protein